MTSINLFPLDACHKFTVDLFFCCVCSCSVPKRQLSSRLKLYGIFEDAQVTRGIDWRWENQDGASSSTLIFQPLMLSESKAMLTIKLNSIDLMSNIHNKQIQKMINICSFTLDTFCHIEY
jgi:hypothetical protein